MQISWGCLLASGLNLAGAATLSTSVLSLAGALFCLSLQPSLQCSSPCSANCVQHTGYSLLPQNFLGEAYTWTAGAPISQGWRTIPCSPGLCVLGYLAYLHALPVSHDNINFTHSVIRHQYESVQGEFIAVKGSWNTHQHFLGKFQRIPRLASWEAESSAYQTHVQQNESSHSVHNG